MNGSNLPERPILGLLQLFWWYSAVLDLVEMPVVVAFSAATAVIVAATFVDVVVYTHVVNVVVLIYV